MVVDRVRGASQLLRDSSDCVSDSSLHAHTEKIERLAIVKQQKEETHWATRSGLWMYA
jgi:hypothetical protein